MRPTRLRVRRMRSFRVRGRLTLVGLPVFCLVRASGDEGRLDARVGRLAAVGSRSRAQKLIDGGRVKVGRTVEKASYKLRAGDVLTVAVPRPVALGVSPEDIPLDVLYEDSDVIVVNKPRGMVVHPGAGNYTGTLVNALMHHCRDLSGIGGVMRPGIVHRIDKDTSGVLMVAKNDVAHACLAAQLKAHEAVRVYYCIVVGEPRADHGRVTSLVGRHPVHRTRMAVVARGGRNAVTNWRTLQLMQGYALVEAKLETGRTHQIRVHMAHLGYPLVGDGLYGEKRGGGPLGPSIARLISGQALHAGLLGFRHPRSGEFLQFSAPIPPDMQAVLDLLRRRAGLPS